MTKDNLHGGNPYVSFATAADLFGSKVSQVAAETRRSLGRWARQVFASNPGSPGAAGLERIFRIQHDLIFNKGVTVSETFTATYSGVAVSTAANLLPFSRGSIHILPGNNDTTVPDTPAIDPKYLAIDFDMAAQVAVGRLVSRLSTTPPLSDLAAGPLLPPDDQGTPPPPPAEAGDEQWRQWTAQAMGPNWHFMGTAAMMARELGGVVDPRLNVYGTRGLRVVDASVLPMQFSGHPTATLYAVAERAAEMIKSDASLSC